MHAYYFVLISSDEVFVCQPKNAHKKTSDEGIVRVVHVVRRVRFPRLRSSNNTSNDEIGTCNRGLMRMAGLSYETVQIQDTLTASVMTVSFVDPGVDGLMRL